MNNNFQIGNQAKCIIRAYHAGAIGNTTIKYDNQPYTVLTEAMAWILSLTIKAVRRFTIRSILRSRARSSVGR